MGPRCVCLPRVDRTLLTTCPLQVVLFDVYLCYLRSWGKVMECRKANTTFALTRSHVQTESHACVINNQAIRLYQSSSELSAYRCSSPIVCLQVPPHPHKAMLVRRQKPNEHSPWLLLFLIRPLNCNITFALNKNPSITPHPSIIRGNLTCRTKTRWLLP